MHHPTASTNNSSGSTVLSPRYSEFKMYNSTFDGLHALDTTANHNGSGSGNDINGAGNININNMPLMRVASLPSMSPAHSGNNGVQSRIPYEMCTSDGSLFTGEKISTPRRELAPPIEEDEEQDSESQRGAPLRQIENNISALLRGDIIVARVGGKGQYFNVTTICQETVKQDWTNDNGGTGVFFFSSFFLQISHHREDH